MFCVPAHSTSIINRKRSLSDSSDFFQRIISVSLYCECFKCPSRLAKMKLLKANYSGPTCHRAVCAVQVLKIRRPNYSDFSVKTMVIPYKLLLEFLVE